MFWSLACAMAMRVNDGFLVFLGLYSGRETRGEVLLRLCCFSEGNTSGRVKITVPSSKFTSFTFQPMLSQALAWGVFFVFVHHSEFCWADAGRSLPIIPSILEKGSLTHLAHLAFRDRYRVRGVYLPLNCLFGETYLLAQLRQMRYLPSTKSSVMQLLQNNCLQRKQRVSFEGTVVRLHRLHLSSESGGRGPPIG